MIKFALSYYSLLDVSLEDIVATIQYGDKVGIHYAVLGQSAVRDAFIGLMQVANATKRIQLGTNIIPIYTRTPTDLAMSVITLNEATGGRFTLLGLGAGGRLKIEPNHGVKVEKTAARMKEYIEIVHIQSHGKTNSIHNEGNGVADKLATYAVKTYQDFMIHTEFSNVCIHLPMS